MVLMKVISYLRCICTGSCHEGMNFTSHISFVTGIHFKQGILFTHTTSVLSVFVETILYCNRKTKSPRTSQMHREVHENFISNIDIQQFSFAWEAKGRCQGCVLSVVLLINTGSLNLRGHGEVGGERNYSH